MKATQAHVVHFKFGSGFNRRLAVAAGTIWMDVREKTCLRKISMHLIDPMSLRSLNEILGIVDEILHVWSVNRE